MTVTGRSAALTKVARGGGGDGGGKDCGGVRAWLGLAGEDNNMRGTTGWEACPTLLHKRTSTLRAWASRPSARANVVMDGASLPSAAWLNSCTEITFR